MGVQCDTCIACTDAYCVDVGVDVCSVVDAVCHACVAGAVGGDVGMGCHGVGVCVCVG